MKNNLIVILCFTAGIFCGTFANTTISTYCEKLPQFLLYALVIQVGLNLGANAELGKMIKDIRFSSLLLPFFTIIGTLVFSAAASLLLTSWNIYDCMAVGSGFAYYSLSSLLIVQLKEASAGIEIASQLGAIALSPRTLFAVRGYSPPSRPIRSASPSPETRALPCAV